MVWIFILCFFIFAMMPIFAALSEELVFNLGTRKWKQKPANSQSKRQTGNSPKRHAIMFVCEICFLGFPESIKSVFSLFRFWCFLPVVSNSFRSNTICGHRRENKVTSGELELESIKEDNEIASVAPD